MQLHAHQSAFTLLELLVALSVFSLVAVMAYGGLDTVLNAGQRIEQQAERLRKLQWALLLLEQDLTQLVARPVRDAFGDRLPALRSSALGINSLELTRGGRPNPTELPRSSLQRVAYGLNNGELQRVTWPVLDRAPDTPVREVILLPGVRELGWRLLRKGGEWTDSWPPQTEDGALSDELPVAVELSLEMDEWGTLRRLFRIPQAGLL